MVEGGGTAPFKRILCGVEGNPASTIAVRAAIELQTPETALHFIAVDASFELRPEYSKESLEAALKEAVELAGASGVAATTDMPSGKYASQVLLDEAGNHDLLVIGTHDQSRVSGILLGSTASEAARRTERPVLIAREPKNGGFFKAILHATDGSEGSMEGARVAAALAAAYGGELELLHVDDGKHPDLAAAVEVEADEIERATGSRPELKTTEGHPTDKIVEAANENGISLIICGRRGLSGIKALGSVSERVVHQAETSVLLVPNP